MRQVAGTLRLDLAQYRELAALRAGFRHRNSSIKATQAQLFRGQRLMEILKQDQYQPQPVEKQIVLIFAATNRYLDSVEVADCGRYETELYAFLDTNYAGLLKMIREKKALDDTVRAELTKALGAFKERFQATAETAAAAK